MASPEEETTARRRNSSGGAAKKAATGRPPTAAPLARPETRPLATCEVTRTHRFFSNFRSLSAVFNIDTSDLDVIASLTEAILASQQHPDYEPVLSGWATFEAIREERDAKGEVILPPFDRTLRRLRFGLG